MASRIKVFFKFSDGRSHLSSRLVYDGIGGAICVNVVYSVIGNAFSSEVGTGSRKESASKQKARASVPIQSERIGSGAWSGKAYPRAMP